MLRRTFALLIAVFVCQVSLAYTPEVLSQFELDLDYQASSKTRMTKAGYKFSFVAVDAKGSVYELIPTEGGTASTLKTKFRIATEAENDLPITVNGTRILVSAPDQEDGVKTYQMYVYGVHETQLRPMRPGAGGGPLGGVRPSND